MVWPSIYPWLLFSQCVKCVLYKNYPPTVLSCVSSTTLNQRTILWRNATHACMSLQHWLCFHTLPNWWHHTWSFIPCYSLYHAVNTCSANGSQIIKKHIIRYFSLNTIMTSYKLTHNSHTKLPQYQQYKINILRKNTGLLSLTHDHSH
jgi:hypothetical protein